MSHYFKSLDGEHRVYSSYLLCDRYRDILSVNNQEPLIARGSGLSPSDASFGFRIQSIDIRHFDRILSFDPKENTVRVEGGISIGDLSQFLLQNERHLPVLPFHPQHTLGGCVACNQIGLTTPNESFKDSIRSLKVYHPTLGIQTLQPGEQLFDLTIGGLGLTGIILEVELKTIPSTHWGWELKNKPVQDLVAGFFSILRSADPSYSWHMLWGSKAEYGRGIFTTASPTGSHGPVKEFTAFHEKDVISELDMTLFSPTSTPLIQEWKYYKEKFKKPEIVHYLKLAFYDAEKRRYWRAFGNQGVLVFEGLIKEVFHQAFFEKLHKLVQRFGPTIPRALFFKHNTEPGLLRFGGTGVVMQLHLPRNEKNRVFLNQLIECACELQMPLNLAQNSCIQEIHARKLFPDFDKIKYALSLYDKDRRFQSGLSRRLGL